MAVRDVCDAVSLLFVGKDRSDVITLTDLFTVFVRVSGRIQLQAKSMNFGKIQTLYSPTNAHVEFIKTN